MLNMLKNIAATALFALASAPAFADAGGGYGGHSGMGWGGWVAGPFMMIVFIGLIVAAVVLTFRLLGVDAAPRSSTRAVDTLNERFARGEIDKAEYEDRRAALSN